MIIKRLGYGKDIIEEIERVCKKNRIKKGWIFFIGAFKNCEIGYYC
ncbi:MAG: DNA-binding protein, partial [Caldiserica bacterium]